MTVIITFVGVCFLYYWDILGRRGCIAAREANQFLPREF